jgi:predicted kinase
MSAPALPEAPRCLLVTGMPGAGKSTVSKLVASALPRAARINGDDLDQMIVSGKVWALGHPADEAARQVELCTRNMVALANNFGAAGFSVVVDTLIPSRPRLDSFIQDVNVPVDLVVLAPGIEACRHRNQHRAAEEQFDFDGYEALEADMRKAFGGTGWWFDTSRLSAEDTAERIVRDASRRATAR